MLPWLSSRPTALARTALSTHSSLEAAVAEVAANLGVASPADLALVFASNSYASDLPRLLPLLRQRLKASHWIGASGGGVVGSNANAKPRELEQGPGLSVTLLRLPGAKLTSFKLDPAQLPDLDGAATPWQQAVGADPADGGAMLVWIDPSSTGINDLISGLDFAYPAMAKVGGLAALHSAGHGSLLLDQEVCGGAVGCVISGDWTVEPVVAQGCRPIGPVFEVEQAQRNILLELRQGDDLNNPVVALQRVIDALPADDRDLLRHSLFVGLARHRFSLQPSTDPLPFLVRNLMGVDPRHGAIAVADSLRVGQRLQFQLRDASTSRQELAQLLQRQQQRSPQPLAALLFACLGRGQGFYGESDVDANLCWEQFGDVPISGLFCNGEIGPVDEATQLHGYTASWGFVVPSKR
jgi:small ligand-binding sensory domain FIST